ncbi:hypothetical protein KC19_1G231400 [Ceratodon purpureus]|uniref:NYN domain-containing protein n=1 Tax=Ceratodon purpureus TaxID=3225 RepID=A0A8T0JBG2_CERPU|nr:hypothetical protein KC19_1G231400 [Ceratodon purpureus]
MDVSASNPDGERSREKQESTSPTFQTLKSLEEPQRSIEPPSHGMKAGSKEVLVWWDIETCPIPSTTSSGSSNAATCLLQELQRQVTCDDISVTIKLYGNGGPGSKAGLDSLVTRGIAILHRILPCKQPGSESAALKTMIVDIALWALTTPATADVFLISATRDTTFRDLINGLHTQTYNIHLATKFSFVNDSTSQVKDSGTQFNSMPRHWSVSKQLFVARTTPSRIDDANPTPNVQLPEKLEQLHLPS